MVRRTNHHENMQNIQSPIYITLGVFCSNRPSWTAPTTKSEPGPSKRAKRVSLQTRKSLSSSKHLLDLSFENTAATPTNQSGGQRQGKYKNKRTNTATGRCSTATGTGRKKHNCENPLIHPRKQKMLVICDRYIAFRARQRPKTR